MSYRAELAKSGRSTCSATACKNEGVKIEKGELRHGVLVTIRENTSMKYRHWGCVTPQVLHNWKETCGMDMELVDGYEELPPDAQAKVKRALEQEHVDDDEWNGDIECNRYVEGKKNQGMFLKTPKKGSKKANDEDGDESPAKKKKQPAKKRARDADEDDEAESQPAAKKTKGRAKKAPKVEEPEDEPAPVKKSKKTKATAPADSGEAPATKPARSKKAKKQPVPEDPEDDEVLVPAKAKASKSKPSKAKSQAKQQPEADDPPKTAPKRKGRGKKAAASEDD